MSAPSIPITDDPAANELLVTDPLALLLGMLLDQQIPMEWAFIGPHRLKERLGGRLDAAEIAAYDPEAFLALCQGPPAIHRFPKSMATRIQAVCQHLLDHHDGDAADLWQGATDGKDLYRRLRALPGYGDEKTKIFIAILAKRLGIRLDGWEQAAGVFGDDVPRSVADVGSPELLVQVREWKKAQKAKGKTKQQ